ncbi:GNAT family N-acetyltransferase [Streptomonospora wellingtoniae]|uniref:Lysine N-acyltransferase MbtK n=1 Tax=Streptomonospora wellingtoniae TaxID=3075544 RepID=A0ABU2KWZ7_9ACTN|nr:GNAT family N-acetyltransferase [Streptomonospora sp. DSM 45055]MDT0303831.1 GNAT family N-acetyltransferase [Streptomonospora sp. DSM 45055]
MSVPESTGVEQVPGAALRRPSPREIPVGEDVLAAGPPPTPVLAPPYAARPAQPQGADLDRVHAWMHLPHVAPFYGQAWSRRRWAEELAAQRAGTFSRPFVVSRDGADLAYVELYRAARDVVARHYDAMPHDIGFHIAIGDPRRTGRGVGKEILDAFAAAVFAAEPRCRRILMEPDAANAAARRAAAKAGLAFLAEADLPHKRAALYVRARE